MDLLCESQKLLYVSIILKRKLSNMEEKCNLQWDLISTYYSPKMLGKKIVPTNTKYTRKSLIKKNIPGDRFFFPRKSQNFRISVS